jgi:hypothetical protein
MCGHAAISNVCDDLLLGSDARVGWFLNRALIHDWVTKFRAASGRQIGTGSSGNRA